MNLGFKVECGEYVSGFCAVLLIYTPSLANAMVVSIEFGSNFNGNAKNRRRVRLPVYLELASLRIFGCIRCHDSVGIEK